MNQDFWGGKRVFLTGHTGFKGGWLALWLSSMGAEVHGFALNPPTNPNFFNVTDLDHKIKSSTIGDIRNIEVLSDALNKARPEIVFHLAAQPLVRESYAKPLETYAVNVMGTINLFEAIRGLKGVKAVVNVTTDKCYENREWFWPYRENEAMGGFDPYSSSKGCSELVTAAYRRSFFSSMSVHLASARAGNVIGGGDWALDRLIPDFLRALDSGTQLVIRSPDAIRPWQHVLEPLSGYLLLAQYLFQFGPKFAEAWNFGPEEGDAKPVRWIVEHLCNEVSNASWKCDDSDQPHEAGLLKLDISKAKHELGWNPRWDLKTALNATLAWNEAWKNGVAMADFSLEQIRSYENWSVPS